MERRKTYHNAILLVRGEESIDLREVQLLVELGVVEVGPDGALHLALRQLRPVERLQRVRGLRHTLRRSQQ